MRLQVATVGHREANVEDHRAEDHERDEHRGDDDDRLAALAVVLSGAT
jgi:hypothetical protein